MTRGVGHDTANRAGLNALRRRTRRKRESRQRDERSQTEVNHGSKIPHRYDNSDTRMTYSVIYRLQNNVFMGLVYYLGTKIGVGARPERTMRRRSPVPSPRARRWASGRPDTPANTRPG